VAAAVVRRVEPGLQDIQRFQVPVIRPPRQRRFESLWARVILPMYYSCTATPDAPELVGDDAHAIPVEQIRMPRSISPRETAQATLARSRVADDFARKAPTCSAGCPSRSRASNVGDQVVSAVVVSDQDGLGSMSSSVLGPALATRGTRGTGYVKAARHRRQEFLVACVLVHLVVKPVRRFYLSFGMNFRRCWMACRAAESGSGLGRISTDVQPA